ncbi:MAG: alpha/beta fold hydrolase [Desulfovibrio sp.]|nr:alpha/beta fold hydrolase [Desulfovibrio sp.]
MGIAAILAVTLAAIFFVPALVSTLAWVENHRSGQWRRQRELLGGRLLSGLLRSFANSVWTLWVTVVALPLGALAGYRREARPGSLPPVILVHGLYHNPAAWFVLRRRLRRAGYADVRCYGYASFFRFFEDIAGGLARMVLEAARNAPGGRVALVGHSLGGLVIRAACADERVRAQVRIAGVATLGTPHRGSTLAGMLGIGRLARGLAPGGEVLRLVRALPVGTYPAVSLYTPTDGMVLPLSGALLEERELANGWREETLPATSHVGLLYSREAARRVLAFLDAVLKAEG